jgi:hypothetical protein
MRAAFPDFAGAQSGLRLLFAAEYFYGFNFSTRCLYSKNDFSDSAERGLEKKRAIRSGRKVAAPWVKSQLKAVMAIAGDTNLEELGINFAFDAGVAYVLVNPHKYCLFVV